MQLSKLAVSLTTIMLAGCVSQPIQDSLQQAEQQFKQYQTLTQQYQINQQWWLDYQDNQLNSLIETALNNNIDLAKAAVAVNIALYQANLVGANLVPTFNATGQSSASKVIHSNNNTISTSSSKISHQVGFNLSYTLDLWGRLRDSASVAEWEKKATEEDLQAARLSLINAVINSYYNLAYFNDAIKVTEQSIKSYEEINRILANKFKVGLIDQLSVAQSEQAVFMAQNSLINLKTAQKTAEQTLRNLLNLSPNSPLAMQTLRLVGVKLQGVDMNVPVSVIAYRPDIMASLSRLQGAFKNVSAMGKSWFPTITLGASLSGNAAKVEQIADTPIAGGLISFSLPFLDWNRVANNVKISEEQYQLAKLNYQQKITAALNEIDGYYYAYQQSADSYTNLQKKYRGDQKISYYYKNRYDQGLSELREWLNALNTERNAELSLLEAKFKQIKNEVAVYQAMAGKFSR